MYQLPADKPFPVGDILINGDAIECGAQIADFIKIKLVGLACRFGQSQAEPVTQCEDGGTFFGGTAVAAGNLADDELSPGRG